MVKKLLLATLFVATSITATSTVETVKGKLARAAASVKGFVAPNGSPKRVIGATAVAAAGAAIYYSADAIRKTSAYQWLKGKCPRLAAKANAAAKATAASKPAVAAAPVKPSAPLNTPTVAQLAALAAREAQGPSSVVVPTAAQSAVLAAPSKPAAPAAPKPTTPAAKPAETSFWSRIFGS